MSSIFTRHRLAGRIRGTPGPQALNASLTAQRWVKRYGDRGQLRPVATVPTGRPARTDLPEVPGSKASGDGLQ